VKKEGKRAANPTQFIPIANSQLNCGWTCLCSMSRYLNSVFVDFLQYIHVMMITVTTLDTADADASVRLTNPLSTSQSNSQRDQRVSHLVQGEDGSLSATDNHNQRCRRTIRIKEQKNGIFST
jgi:glucose/arabinose dehydrogenase